MRCAIILVLALILASGVSAYEIGPRVPPKTDSHARGGPIADTREGGETIADAFVIPSLPYTDTGATCDNIDDYDEMCPYTGIAPDVVYSLVPPQNLMLRIDLCGSSYDTKVYVYDAGMNLMACNDDYYYDDECGYYTSFIDGLPVPGGEEIFIVVDGYMYECGEYLLYVDEHGFDCVLDCPPDATHEGEPELMDGYDDAYNSGCGYHGPGSPLLQELWGDADQHLYFCGVSGWYDYDSMEFRDTDWYTVILGEAGMLDVAFVAEQYAYLFHLAPTDCAEVEVAQSVGPDPCVYAEMTVTGEPGEAVWLWVGPQDFSSPAGFLGHEFDYHIELDGLASGVIGVEARTWSGVKGLYR